MAKAGTKTFNLTLAVRGSASAEVFNALKNGLPVPEGAIEDVGLKMLGVVQGNNDSVAPVRVQKGVYLVKTGATNLKKWLPRLDKTKPWVVYSQDDVDAAEFGIRLHYPISDSIPEQFRIVVINRTTRNFLYDNTYAFCK